MTTRTRFDGLQLAVEDRAELQRMRRGRKALTARVWRRIQVLLLLDAGQTVRATAIAVGGYPREVSRVGKRYVRNGLQHALTEEPRPKPAPKLDSSQQAAVVAMVAAVTTDPSARCIRQPARAVARKPRFRSSREVTSPCTVRTAISRAPTAGRA